MINLSLRVLEKLHSGRNNFSGTEMIALVAYWYGHSKSNELRYQIEQTEENGVAFIKSYNNIIRLFHLGGVDKKEIKKGIRDYLSVISRMIMAFDLKEVNPSQMMVLFIEAIIISISYKSLSKHKSSELLSPVFNKIRNWQHKGDLPSFMVWISLFEYYFGISTDKIAYSQKDDNLAKFILDVDSEQFSKELETREKDSVARGKKRIEEGQRSEFFLSKVSGFYDISFGILRNGYEKLFLFIKKSYLYSRK